MIMDQKDIPEKTGRAKKFEPRFTQRISKEQRKAILAKMYPKNTRKDAS